MKFTQVLPLVAVGAAIVLPQGDLLQELLKQNDARPANTITETITAAENAIDEAFQSATERVASFDETLFHASHRLEEWLDVSDEADVSQWLPHRHRGCGRGHHSLGPIYTNMTLYEMITSNNYTQKLAKFVQRFDDLVDTLNSTSANFTLFAPVDAAFDKFEKLPKRFKPSDDVIKKVLTYHLSPDFHPTMDLFHRYTLPTAYKPKSLGKNPQRIRINLTWRGLKLNYFTKLITPEMYASNGLVLGVDNILVPPPSALTILEVLPEEFSTLAFGLDKTGLAAAIADTPHEGGTIFAPTNDAFKQLGLKANAFLFSEYGRKYLKALLKYHVVANQTLYTDEFYKLKTDGASSVGQSFHVDLPTLLRDKFLSIDVLSDSFFTTIKINGFTSVSIHDGIAKDGVIQVVPKVLIPPKTPAAAQLERGEDVGVEELMESLIPGDGRRDLK